MIAFAIIDVNYYSNYCMKFRTKSVLYKNTDCLTQHSFVEFVSKLEQKINHDDLIKMFLSNKMKTALCLRIVLNLVGLKHCKGSTLNIEYTRKELTHGSSKFTRNNIQRNVESLIFDPPLITPETLELQYNVPLQSKMDKDSQKRKITKKDKTRSRRGGRYHKKNKGQNRLGYVLDLKGKNSLKLRLCRSFSWRFSAC